MTRHRPTTKTGFFGAPSPPLPSPRAGHTHRRLQQGGPAGGGLSLGPSYRMGDPGIEPSPRTPYIEPPPAVGEWGANRVMSRVLPPVNAVRAAIVRPPPLIYRGWRMPREYGCLRNGDSCVLSLLSNNLIRPGLSTPGSTSPSFHRCWIMRIASTSSRWRVLLKSLLIESALFPVEPLFLSTHSVPPR